MPKMRTPSTGRLYAGWQEQFREWCLFHKVTFPPADHAVIATYLREYGHKRGAHSARAVLSALGKYYRSHGMPLDTQMPAIQRVMVPMRARIRNGR
jgi:hypothetical protein